jgi:septal ring factor EnvC (AmiA/AmiB activator)
VCFRYKTPGPNSPEQYGLIAQQVERVFPELVSVDAKGFKQVNYSELPYLMLQAIRELKAENDRLRAEKGEIQRQMASLEARLAQVEARTKKLQPR